MNWFLLSRGERIRTCDQVVRKHPPRKMRYPIREKSGAIAYWLVLKENLLVLKSRMITQGFA